MSQTQTLSCPIKPAQMQPCYYFFRLVNNSHCKQRSKKKKKPLILLSVLAAEDKKKKLCASTMYSPSFAHSTVAIKQLSSSRGKEAERKGACLSVGSQAAAAAGRYVSFKCPSSTSPSTTNPQWQINTSKHQRSHRH